MNSMKFILPLKYTCLAMMLWTGAQLKAQIIVRNYGTDCVDAPQAFSANCSGNCSNFSWSVSGSHTEPGGGYTSSSIGGFSWSSSGSRSVSVSFLQDGNPISDTYNLTISPVVVPEVTISQSPSGSTVYGTMVTFSIATINHGGTSLTYQWFLNNVLQPGENGTEYATNILQSGEQVFLRITSNAVCANPTDDSNIITAAVTYLITTPTVTDVQIPYNTSTTLSANGAGTNEVYRWYTAPSGGTYFEGLTYPTPNLTSNTTFYVSVRNTSTGAESARAPQLVSLTFPSSPVVVDVEIPYNTSTTLLASGAGANEAYRWYTAPSGGTFYEGLTYTTPVLTNSTTYYVSKINTSTSAESPRVPQAIALIIPAPDVPAMSQNTCGPKILTRGTPPANITWYWIGTDPNATAESSDQTYVINSSNNEKYYIRAKLGNSWSPAVGVTVSTDPVDLILYTYDVQEVQATHSITLATGFTVPAGKPFTARIGVTSECNDIYNWSEQITYNEQGETIARSKVYSNGLGEGLQSQSIDFATQKVWASQPIQDNQNQASLSTLPAPIQESDFIYKKNFVTSAITGEAYGPNDFDKPVVSNGTGEVYNPVAVGTQPGTLGWYYSSNNNLEPATPTTNYPYSRSYTEPGPNPVKTESTGPGDASKMGNGHQMVGERHKFLKSELSNYFTLRPHFVNTPLLVSAPGTNLISNSEGASLSGYSAVENVTISLIAPFGKTYVKVLSNQPSGNPGVKPVSGTIAVTPGATYTFKVLGYRSSAISVSLNIKNASTGEDIVWPGETLPAGAGNEDWAENTFVVPAGCTAIEISMRWSDAPYVNDAFFINALSLTQVANTESMTYGYKIVSTNPDGKKAVSFNDADGGVLASAIITSTNNSTTPPTYTYDNWSYIYYNDMGQVVASVAPNGVTGQETLPSFVTYSKYDQLGRVIETSSPDEGMSQFVYNTDGQIRFSQNQAQREASPQRFSYTNYDYLGRLIESGEYASSGSNPYVFEPHTTATPGAFSILNIIDNTGFTGVSRKVVAQESRCTDYTFIEYDVQASDFTGGPASFQTNLLGQVSKTENAISKTWYSYDEFGQLLWSKQNITGLGDKTIEYTYDYFGNVAEIAYQKGSTNDRFYHHYTYDINRRLSEVHTSKDGVTKTLHAKYYYYLHGPLKRVELGTNLQGIDYVYNIDGSLKLINHADPNLDPGLDGISGPHANFMKDVFGEVLDYNTNDYTGAGYNEGTLNLGTYTDQFGGAVKAIRWHSPTDSHVPRAYAFTYDNLNQMDNANWGNMTGTSGTYGLSLSGTQAYKEDIGGYDKNGNIQSLVRKGKIGNDLANYNYAYEANTNKLNSVAHNGTPLLDYEYNSIGQMTEQAEGSNTMKVSYNVFGLVKEVRDGSDALRESFAYDDRGNRVLRTNYTDGAPSKNTYYVYDASGNVLAIYEQSLPGGTPQLAEVPVYGAGRVAVHKPAVSTYFYEISDHLGNVRGVIGNPETLIYTATVEDNGLAEITNPRVQEMAYYKNLSTTEKEDPDMNHTAPSTYMPSPEYSAYLNWIGGLSSQKSVGPAIGLKVEPGDKLDLETWAKYEKKTEDYSRPGIVGAMASILGSNFVGTAAGLDVLANATQVFQDGLTTAVGVATGNGNDLLNTHPYAYLYYLLYDKNFTPITAGWSRIPASAGHDPGDGPFSSHQQLTIPTVTITEPGYIYVFVANESEDTKVWFDDVKVTHKRSTIVAGADYYPFGLVMDGREITREDYRYGYQGQFSEKDLTTEMQEFELRMYDPNIGRWISPDPYRGAFNTPYSGMANQPHIRIDPDGGCPAPCPITTYYLNAVEIVATSEVGRAISTAALRTATLFSYVGSRLANGAVKTGNDINQAFLNSRYFANSALHTITLGTWEKWEPSDQQQGYLQSAGQGFGEGVLVVNAVGGGLTQRPSPLLATPNGNVPITMPVVLNPSFTMSKVHQLNAGKSLNQLNKDVQAGRAPKGIKRFDKGKDTKNLPEDEVHFDDGSSLYRSGKWRHDKGHRLTNDQTKYLKENGWTIPE